MLKRRDNLKTILTQLVVQVSRSGKAIKALTWRMNSGHGFLPMALRNAEPGATVRLEVMKGGWSSSGDAKAESGPSSSIGPQRTPPNPRSFIEGQWRRGGEKALDITYQLQSVPPLRWDHGGEAWIGR